MDSSARAPIAASVRATHSSSAVSASLLDRLRSASCAHTRDDVQGRAIVRLAPQSHGKPGAAAHQHHHHHDTLPWWLAAPALAVLATLLLTCLYVIRLEQAQVRSSTHRSSSTQRIETTQQA